MKTQLCDGGFNCINFGTELKREKYIEDLNYTSSGTTTEEGPSLQRDSRSGGEPNLDLSIGLAPFQSESTRAVSGNSAESKLGLVQSAATTTVCLCWQLGFQSG